MRLGPAVVNKGSQSPGGLVEGFRRRSTASVFLHATAVPKAIMSVIPPNPQLAKLSIEPIELIDDVDVHYERGAGLRRKGAGCGYQGDGGVSSNRSSTVFAGF
jgi:hypothetical protein